MQLRSHPHLSWPPSWGGSMAPYDRIPMGEDGILKDVVLNADHLSLAIDYEGRDWKGILIVKSEESTFVQQVHNELNQNLGNPISEIGNLEIDF